MTDRRVDLISALDNDPTLAITRARLASALGLSRGQFDYLMRTDPEAREAYDQARTVIREDRCATRRCWMCGLRKPAAEFPRDRRDGCGIGRKCLVCNRLSVRAYRHSQS